MARDPFTDILGLMSVQCVVSGSFVAGGPWALQFQPPERIKFFIVARGSCWMELEGIGEPFRLEQGDVFLLTAQRSFVLASDRTAQPRSAVEAFAGQSGRWLSLGEGDDFLLLGGHVQLDSVSGRLLVDSLPAVVHVRAGSAEATALEWLIDQLVTENGGDRPGSDFASTQLAQLVFLHIMRAHLANADALAASQLRAISDPRLAPAMRLMHDEPSRGWRLFELAKAAAMSRTAFAVYFKSVAGVAPLTYLTEWRMRLAERALAETDIPVARVAESVGYSSESSFSTAFRRLVGNAPKRYRDAARRRPDQNAPTSLAVGA